MTQVLLSSFVLPRVHGHYFSAPISHHFPLIGHDFSWPLQSFQSLFIPASSSHYGHFLGEFSNKIEGLSGKLYIVDQKTLFLQDFKYQGEDKGSVCQLPPEASGL